MDQSSIPAEAIAKRSFEAGRRFTELYGPRCRMMFRAPGRINLIGEHTDYNDGFVMPAAIDLSCWAALLTM